MLPKIKNRLPVNNPFHKYRSAHHRQPVSTKLIGGQGELLALKFLTQKGYRLITQNFHIWGGELDLIMKKNGQIVFIEVKTRTGDSFGRAEETLSKKQKLKLIRAIYQYLSINNCQKSWRLDLIAINFTSASRAEVRHIKNILEE